MKRGIAVLLIITDDNDESLDVHYSRRDNADLTKEDERTAFCLLEDRLEECLANGEPFTFPKSEIYFFTDTPDSEDELANLYNALNPPLD